jgi:hypothetical protein
MAAVFVGPLVRKCSCVELLIIVVVEAYIYILIKIDINLRFCGFKDEHRGTKQSWQKLAAAAYLHRVEKTLDLFTRLVGNLQFLYRFRSV